jgi:hypothetical protein
MLRLFLYIVHNWRPGRLTQRVRLPYEASTSLRLRRLRRSRGIQIFDICLAASILCELLTKENASQLLPSPRPCPGRWGQPGKGILARGPPTVNRGMVGRLIL